LTTLGNGAGMKIIDVHAHVLTKEAMDRLQREVPQVRLRMTPIDDESSVIEVAGVAYRPYPRGAWDLERRFKDMDFAEVDMQVLSNTPQTFLYDQDPDLTTKTARIQNDEIARLVATYPERFQGLATLPMQAPDLAAAELTRAMRSLGLKGAQIGSNVNGRNLDDPSFEPLWAAANENAAIIMVHPNNVAGAERMKSYYLNNLIGNPLDTTIAAACLVFGGVIERFPAIRFFMVHGGGFLPYQAGRWEHGWHVRPEPRLHLKQPPAASIRKLYFDTILHAAPALEFLVSAFGAARVVLGSDYPYDMGTLECVRQVRSLSISDTDKEAILSGRSLLGETGVRSEMTPARSA
jgi:aminocarboxymuconate-semialdehyde decarboxylase